MSRATLPVPDLLDSEARIRVDAAELRQTLVFAFATGGSVESFDHALADAELPASSWDPKHFARDIFLDALVAGPLAIRIGGRAYPAPTTYLLRALSRPPADPAVCAMRCDVLAELDATPAFRAELEARFVELVSLRALFCVGRDATPRLRRLEIFRTVRALVDAFASSFEGATSALGRLRTFGAAIQATDAYTRLDALLDHEANLATVDLRVRVGADGEISNFQIVAVRENKANPFYGSALGRFLGKLLLFLRGYRVSGGEIAESLYESVFTGLEEALLGMFQLIGDMSFYLAALGLADRARAAGLDVCLPEWVEPGASRTELEGLWNPLLLEPPRAPRPADIGAASDGCVVMVTGPNSGGKTRLLQAIAIAQLTGEAGLFVPAKRARMCRAQGLFVSLLEEARADQPEGQLGMELVRIRRIFEELEPGSLVLLDELCSGTNPSEGVEIAELVLSLLPELDARAFVTTHLLQFAARLADERPIPGLDFLQVALDDKDRPTFRFVEGVAKTSLARQTAARLGVTREELREVIATRKRARDGRKHGEAKPREPAWSAPTSSGDPGRARQ